MALHRPTPPRYIEPIFVGLAGRIGSGKTSAANYLSSKYDFQYVRYSQVLQEWSLSDSSDRGRLQQLGWDVMESGLQAELTARVIAELDRSKSAVIDGLRHLVDFQGLSSTFGASFEMIFLEAGLEHRFTRVQARFSTLAAFHSADTHPVEGHIDDLRPLASITMPNDGSPEHLCRRLDAWIALRRLGVRQ